MMGHNHNTNTFILSSNYLLYTCYLKYVTFQLRLICLKADVKELLLKL